MKIISPFTDYYDYMRAYGEDPKLIYVRKTKVSRSLPSRDWLLPTAPSLSLKKGFVAFCGWAYPFYQACREDGAVKYIYSFDSLINFFGGFPYSNSYNFNERNCIEGFKKRSMPNEKFLEKKCPIFAEVYRDYSYCTVENPKLRDLGFEQVKDGMTAWQELSMFMSNVMNRSSEPTLVGDDIVIATTKGFDPKSSFRQSKPGNKKERRKENKRRKRMQ